MTQAPHPSPAAPAGDPEKQKDQGADSAAVPVTDAPAQRSDVEGLAKDAARWRAFEESGHLMIVDFDRRESGTFKTTKRAAIDAAIEAERAAGGDRGDMP